VPCHIDLQALAAAETRARSCVSGEADGLGVWASVAARVSFQQFNFLEGLPYDSGVFDMVHIRFVGLGVPETHWAELLDEAVRVLRPGGVIEIVEMSCEPPPSAPASVANSFASQLLSDFIPQNPVLALQMHLPATAALAHGSTKPLFQRSWSVGAQREEEDYFSLAPYGGPRGAAPPAIADAAPAWIRSSLSYRGTGLNALRDSGTGPRAAMELAARDPSRWGSVPPPGEEDEPPRTPATGPGRISLAAWVSVKM
jgi:SAM-dependent methyltransferase